MEEIVIKIVHTTAAEEAQAAFVKRKYFGPDWVDLVLNPDTKQ